MSHSPRHGPLLQSHCSHALQNCLATASCHCSLPECAAPLRSEPQRVPEVWLHSHPLPFLRRPFSGSGGVLSPSSLPFRPLGPIPLVLSPHASLHCTTFCDAASNPHSLLCSVRFVELCQRQQKEGDMDGMCPHKSVCGCTNPSVMVIEGVIRVR